MERPIYIGSCFPSTARKSGDGVVFVQDESLKHINERGDIHIQTKIHSIGLKISFSVDCYVDILLQTF